MKNKITHCRNIQNSNRKIGERGKIDIRKTQIHDYSLAWLGIDISMKSDGVKLVFMGTNNFFKN
jgi:hypothetical protein